MKISASIAAEIASCSVLQKQNQNSQMRVRNLTPWKKLSKQTLLVSGNGSAILCPFSFCESLPSLEFMFGHWLQSCPCYLQSLFSRNCNCHGTCVWLSRLWLVMIGAYIACETSFLHSGWSLHFEWVLSLDNSCFDRIGLNERDQHWVVNMFVESDPVVKHFLESAVEVRHCRKFFIFL